MKAIQGGVGAAKGFTAGAIHSGIRKAKTKEDLALIVSSVPCQCAAVYTKNQVKADPLQVTKEHLGNHRAQAVIVNSGNANACAVNGYANAVRQAQAAADYLSIPAEDVLVASTGVIGQELPIECIEKAVKELEGTIVPHDTVIDELRELAAKQDIESEDLAIAMAAYMLGFGTYKGFTK